MGGSVLMHWYTPSDGNTPSGRSRGVPLAHAPHGSRFFHFDIQIFQNVAASGVGAPLRGQHPPMGNPGSATDS